MLKSVFRRQTCSSTTTAAAMISGRAWLAPVKSIFRRQYTTSMLMTAHGRSFPSRSITAGVSLAAAKYKKRREADERRDERGDRDEQNGVRIHTLSPPFFVRRASSTKRQQSMPPIVGSRKLSAPNRRRQTIETPRPMSAGA